tara:strand:+ start:438 stop:638 length:201 start_codon:yes stop_codon:yes gene_type:complete
VFVFRNNNRSKSPSVAPNFKEKILKIVLFLINVPQMTNLNMANLKGGGDIVSAFEQVALHLLQADA